MRFRYFFLVLFFIPTLVVAQYDSSPDGRFRIDEKKGCASFTTTITNANLITVGECTALKPCVMNWGDGSAPQTNSFTHTYTQPGTYTLNVLYQTIGSNNIDITVTPNTLPAFDVFTCGGQEVQVKVTDTNYDSYFIYYGDGSPDVAVPVGILATDNYTYAFAGPWIISVRGKNLSAADNCTPTPKPVDALPVLATPFVDLLTVASTSQTDLSFANATNVLYKVEIAANTTSAASFQLVQTIHDVNTSTITNLRSDDNYYCFRLGAFDPCNNTTTYSNVICSANFDLSLQSNSNNLSWASSAAGVSNFDISRDGGSIGTTGALLFSDNTAVCKTSYCYQLSTNYVNGSQSISLEKCGEAFSSDIPTKIENITAVVNNGSVDLTWQQDPAFQSVEYSVFRKSGTGSFNLLSKTAPTQITDMGYSTGADVCYRISYIDVCDNISDTGIDICPIRLTGSIADDNSITLNWSAYAGWVNGVSGYTVEKYDGNGVLLQQFPLPSTSTTLDDNVADPANQLYVYVVKADAIDPGLGQSVSNEITVIKEPKLHYPTAFTPDKQGDIKNEIFRVFGQYVSKFEMNIFNRWGELLFTTNNLDLGWDGNYKGKEQPEGTYAFVANITDLTGRTFKRSGSVVLLRKK